MQKIRLHYVEAGNPSGQLMLFVHGFPDCWLVWKNQMKEFSSLGYHVVSVDMRGYGDSDKPFGSYTHS